MATSDNFSSIETMLQNTLTLENLPEEAVKNLQGLESLVKIEKLRNQGVLSKFRLDNQVALVTGGSRGIGLAIATALGEAGCKVAVASTKLENSKRAAAILEQKGIEALPLEVDVANKESVNEMVKNVLAKWGDLHIAVNNAGICSNAETVAFPEETYDHLMGINLKGVFLCCQAEGQHMIKKNYGRVINMASISGHISNVPQIQAAYNASKAAVIQLTKTLAAEWAEKGVTVNSISPGYIETDMLGGANNPMREVWTPLTPMKRFGEPTELQGLAVLLASSLSSYMTGSDVIVDGGYVLW